MYECLIASDLRWIAPRYAANFAMLLSKTSNLGPRKRIGVRYMSKAVQFDLYGGIDVLQVRDVPRPVPGAGEVLVQVRAAGINISEAVLRRGALHDLWPLTFPFGQGSDLAGAGVVIGFGVNGFAVWDVGYGFSNRRYRYS